MNRLAWTGTIVWGLFLTGWGLLSAGPNPGAAASLPGHDVVLLIAGGLLTCLIGVIGLFNVLGWTRVPRSEHKTYS